jgi:hypothetical protein
MRDGFRLMPPVDCVREKNSLNTVMSGPSLSSVGRNCSTFESRLKRGSKAPASSKATIAK